MSPRRSFAAAVSIVVMSGLAACSAPAAPSATPPTPTTVVETSEPTPTAMTVGPGQRPPQVFDGDCNDMLTLSEVSDAVGEPASLIADGAVPGYTTDRGAGALSCAWDAAGIDLRVAVFPRSGITGVNVPLSGLDPYRQNEDCEWYCTAVIDGEDHVVVISHNDGRNAGMSTPEMTAEIAAALGPTVLERALAAGTAWNRDRTGWLRLDCDELGTAVAAETGLELVGHDWSLYIDSPLPAGLLADAAAQLHACKLVDPAGLHVELWSVAGAAWGGEAGTAGGGLPAPWVGHATEAGHRYDGTYGPGWVMTDGVNVVRLTSVPEELGIDIEEWASAVAAALAPAA